MAITDNTQCATIPYVTLDSCLISPTYITETWQKKKNQPKLIHTLIVAPIVHMRHLTPHTRYTIYDTFSHTHTLRHTHTPTRSNSPHYSAPTPFFPMLLCNKPIEYTHTHKMHIINFKIRNSYNATNALKKKRKKKKTITTNPHLRG